jgi:hypothetical protein
MTVLMSMIKPKKPGIFRCLRFPAKIVTYAGAAIKAGLRFPHPIFAAADEQL